MQPPIYGLTEKSRFCARVFLLLMLQGRDRKEKMLNN